MNQINNDKSIPTMLFRSDNVALFEVTNQFQGSRIFSVVSLEPKEDYEFKIDDFHDTSFKRSVITRARRSEAVEKYEAIISGRLNITEQIKKDYCITSITPSTTNADEPKKARGRKSKEIKFPDGEFTMEELADFNNMKKNNIYQLLRNKNILDKMPIVRENKGRGKPTKVYSAPELETSN